MLQPCTRSSTWRAVARSQAPLASRRSSTPGPSPARAARTRSASTAGSAAPTLSLTAVNPASTAPPAACSTAEGSGAVTSALTATSERGAGVPSAARYSANRRPARRACRSAQAPVTPPWRGERPGGPLQRCRARPRRPHRSRRARSAARPRSRAGSCATIPGRGLASPQPVTPSSASETRNPARNRIETPPVKSGVCNASRKGWSWARNAVTGCLHLRPCLLRPRR